MTQQFSASQTRAGFFDTIEQADLAIRQLLAAGFSKDQLAVICPAKFKDHFITEAPQAEAPAAGTQGSMAMGGAMGATLGGLALAATVLTGGAAGVMTAAVLLGGGAFAGAFSNLIIANGYEEEVDDHYKHAIERGQIVVGVLVHDEDEDSTGQLAKALRILDEARAEGEHAST